MKTIFTLLAVLVMTFTQAQWTADTAVNTLVAASGATDMQAKGTSTGETYVVFWKVVPAPTNFELRMQVLDANGNQTLGEDGILISDQIPMSTFTVIWSLTVDSDDNAYIGITGTGGGNPAFVYKVDTTGTQLWSNNSVGSGNLVTVLPLASGDAIVGMLGGSGGVMQKYDTTGTAVWASEQPIGTGAGFKAPANFFELSGGDFMLVHHRLLSGVNSNLYAQRYNAIGEPQWTNDTQLSDRTTLFNRQYNGVQGDGVVYMSYFGTNGSRFDAFLQRIDPDGTIPWGLNGTDFATDDLNYETTISVAITDDNSNVYAASRYTNTSQSMTGTYIQKFDTATGNRLFTDTAKELFAIGDEIVPVGQFHLLENTPWFAVENGVDNGANPTILEAVYLDEDGEFVWVEETKPLATFSADKSRVHYTAPADGQSVAVFVEDKGAGARMYAQNMEEVVGCALSITCPSDITVTTDSGVCTASGVSLGAAVTNGCAGEVITNDAPTVFPVGETMVTWTVDNGSTSETCVQLVVVEDNTAPVITCPVDTTVEVGTNSLYALPDYFGTGDASVIDNCTSPITITSQDPIAGTNLAVGTHQIELTAEDAFGNESMCSFQLTVGELLGTQTFTNESVSLVPNPAQETITLSNLSGLQLNALQVYDVTGRLVKTYDLTGTGNSQFFDISNMVNGTYFLLIEGEKGQITKKLVKN